MALATLSIDLVAKLANFERDLGAAARASEKQAARIESSFSKVGATIKSLGVVAIGTTIGSSIVSMANEARQAIDDMKDLADATGASIENISALDGIARETGATIGDVSGILIKFNGVLKEADPEKGAGAVLKSLNLDIEELKRLDPAEALRLVAVELERYADNGDKARAVQELFGKSVKDAAPFLKDLAESGGLVARVTSEQAEEVDRFNKELFKLQANVIDVSRALTIDLVTGLNKVVASFRAGQAEGKTFWEIASGNYVRDVKNFYGFGDQSSGRRSASGPVIDPRDQSAAELARLTRQNEKPTLKLPPAAPAGGGGRSGGRGAGRTGKDPILEANEKEAGMLKLLADIRQKEIKTSREAAIEEFEALEKRNEKHQDYINSLLEATPTAQLEKQRQTMLDLAAAFESGQISAEQFGEAATTYLGNLPEDIEKANEAASDLGMTFASAFEDAIVNASSLKDVLKGLEQDIIRIITRKLVTEPLANAATSWISTAIGAFAGGGAAFADGGVMTPHGPLPLKTYARGGVASSPQVAVFGEGAMNEAYVPLPDGRRIPVQMRGGKGAGGTVNHMSFNFTVPATVDRRTQEQIAHMAGAAVQRANRRLS